MTADTACALSTNTRIYIYARTQHSTAQHSQSSGERVRLRYCAINFHQSNFLLNLNI